MPRLMHLAGAAAVLLASACSEPTAPAVAPRELGPSMTIADAAHAGGPQHFYFLPPVVKAPASFGGTFDPALSPRVEVCQLSGAVCGATVATFVSGGSGPDAVKLDAGGQKYQVNFQTHRYSLDPSRTYRITVYSGAVVLGYADLKVVKSGGDQKNVDPEQYAVVKNGSTLPISFRIEQGIAGAVTVTPPLDTIPVGGTAQFTATVTDLHGAPLPGAAVTWSAEPAAVATIDATGLATGVAIGTATVTATSGSVSGSATLVVKTPNHPPVAVSDTFQAIGNVTVPVAAPGVLAHDSDPDGDALSAVPGTFPTAGGGTVTIAADGSLSYLSAPGFTGTDSAAYRVTDGIAEDTAEVVFTVPTRVWYVRNTASAPGDGRDASPFATLAAAEAASTAGETIFVLFGDVSVNGLDAGFTFKPGQSLIGQGVSSPVVATVNGAPLVLLAAGMAPTIGRASAGAAVQLATGNTLRGLGVASSAGAGVAGSGFGTFTASEVAVGATGGPGVDLTGGTLAVALSNLSSGGSAGAGLHLAAVSGTFTAAGGSISGAAGAGVDLAGGDADVSYAGSVSSTAGRSVSVTGRTGGTVDLSGDVSDSAGGILVQGNTGGTVQLTGSSKTLSTGASNGVTLAGNAGATVRFGGGGLNVTTTTGTAFSATGGGTVIVTGPHNVLSAAGGPALSVVATDVGSGGLTFESVSADGGVNGIVLNGTGVVSGLLVTGNGSPASGGTIRNTTGAGVLLAGTQAPSFAHVSIQNTGASGVKGTRVVGFSFTDGSIDNSGTGLGTGDSNIAFDDAAFGTENNLSGAVTITGNTLSNAFFHGIDVFNLSGTITSVDISGNTVTSSTSAASSKGSGIRLIASGSGASVANVVAGSVSGNTVTNFPSGSGIVVRGGNPSAAGPSGSFGTPNDPSRVVSVTGNQIAGQAASKMGLSAIDAAVSGVGQGNLDVSGNGTAASPIANVTGTAVSVSVLGFASASVSITNNWISPSNLFGSQGIGFGVANLFTTADTPLMTANVTGNHVSATDGNGILGSARGGIGTLRARVQNNVVAAPTAAASRQGIRIDSGSATGNSTVCLDISGNTSAGSGVSLGIGLRKQGTNPAVNAFGVVGMAATSTPGVEAYVSGQNPAGGGTNLLSATSGFSSCTLP